MTIVKLYRALLIDNFETESLRLWSGEDNGAGTSQLIAEENPFVKDGLSSLLFSSQTGVTQSGWHDAIYKFDYVGSPQDLSNYTDIFMWVFCGTTTDPPILKLRVRNDGTTTEVGFATEVKDDWAFVGADISAITRDAVDELRFRMYETSYGSQEIVNFYMDTICAVSSTEAFNLTNTDEDIDVQRTEMSMEVPMGGGLRPVFDFGQEATRITISGIIPETTTETALEREAALEDLLLGSNLYVLESDIYSGLVKMASYTSTITAGQVESIPYTLGLVECFGNEYVPR